MVAPAIATPPRLAPPMPRRSKVGEWRAMAKLAKIKPMPWQDLAAIYLMATYRYRWLYPEISIVVSRQNGKSEILVPRLLRALQVGERVIHSAQDRALPRETFERVADLTPLSWLRRPIRLANGQERIETWSGGRYKIVAPTRAGARGGSNDLVIIDEARELDTWEFVAAVGPTTTASKNPQKIYLSNAGDKTSVVLNGIRRRAADDPQLCYLEWSAPKELSIDDRAGWAMANPALGFTIRIETLERARLEYADEPSVFETEHLCRWVTSMATSIVSEIAWQRSAYDTERPVRPALGIAVDPHGRRISAAIAWQQSDGTIGLRMAAEIHGDPVDVAEVGARMRQLSADAGVSRVGFGPDTDKDLARYLERKTQKAFTHGITTTEFEAACSRFVATIEGGRLRWQDAGDVGADLPFTVRHDKGEGRWIAARADEDRPITAALAAIRAVWLATNPADVVPTVH